MVTTHTATAVAVHDVHERARSEPRYTYVRLRLPLLARLRSTADRVLNQPYTVFGACIDRVGGKGFLQISFIDLSHYVRDDGESLINKLRIIINSFDRSTSIIRCLLDLLLSSHLARMFDLALAGPSLAMHR